LKRKLVLLCVGLISSGCFDAASRDNPLDPLGASYSPRGRIVGYVGAYYQTAIPLSGVMVFLYPSGNYTLSGTDGSFEFSRLPAGEYKLRLIQPGYRSDSMAVSVQNDTRQVQFRLNAVPVFRQTILQTHHISRWWPSDDLYYLTVSTEIEDSDGSNDIDSVWVEISTGTGVFPLVRKDQDGNFSAEIMEQDLNVSSLYALQGIEIKIYCLDQVGNQSESENLFLPRVIEQIPTLLYPTELASVGEGPLSFTWEPLFPGFPFTQKIEIYQINAGIYNRIYEFEDLPNNATDFAFDGHLDQGDYFWVLYIIDEFGDSCRSKEGAFRVIQELN
jgi:hypothetical protein